MLHVVSFKLTEDYLSFAALSFPLTTPLIILFFSKDDPLRLRSLFQGALQMKTNKYTNTRIVIHTYIFIYI